MKYQCSIFAASLAVCVLSTSGCGDDDGQSADLRARDAGPGVEEMDARVGDGGKAGDAGSSKQDAGQAAADGGVVGPPPPVDGGAVTGTEAGIRDAASTGDAGPTADAAGTCDAPAVPPLKLAPVAGVGTLAALVFAAQPNGSTDWYLVQQTGTIRVLSGGALRAESFLDVSAQIANADGERGLLGLAFPDDYAQSGKFYVMMTPTRSGNGQDNADRDVVFEYQRSAADPYVADPASAKTLVRLDVSATNHNGGNLVFGPDGFLYVGTGDGGGGCSSNKVGAPQNVGSLFGKILRLDPAAAGPEYAAAGNPFASGGDARVLHYGLRNPFRFAFDRATGDMYIGDVGQDSYEELDFVSAGTKGLNFGWPKYEGNHADTCGTSQMLRAGSTATPAFVDIDRRVVTSAAPFADYVSIIAGPVYRGAAIPQLQGVSLFGDYTGLRFGAVVRCGTQASPPTVIRKNRDANSPTTAHFARDAGQPAFGALTAIVEDNAGELYLVANRNTLLKVVPGP